MMSKDTETVATRLGRIILARPDYVDLVQRTEAIVAEYFLTHKITDEPLHRLIAPGLRFADILSHSDKAEHRERAYALIAMFQELKEQQQLDAESIQRLEAFSIAVFSVLGNFPGLRKLEESDESDGYQVPAERLFARGFKEFHQRTSDRSSVLTDAQYEIATTMESVDFYSFSGPTSLGKSFVIKNFLKAEVQKPQLADACVIFLVPTNALVAQTANDLRKLLEGLATVNVAIYPDQPEIMKRLFATTVFVFTPERLIRFLNAPNRSIKLLIVDEAHKIVAENDSRSPLFYYAIDETVRSFATKLIFSSPSLSNPELFLELFGKSTGGSMVVRERTVTQQRFYVDFIDREASYFSSDLESERILVESVDQMSWAPEEAVKFWANGAKSLVYANTPSKVVSHALSFAGEKNVEISQQVHRLIERIGREIHPQYYLIDVLKRGVAFHHGKMPVAIREDIESVFKSEASGIDFLFCTSTLLEGVNLPAKNIFILTDKYGGGRSSFGKLDFENLAGRAGRLTEDFQGNVICIRADDETWKDPDLQIPITSPTEVTSFMVPPPKSKGRKNYTDIAKVLQGRSVSGTRSDQQSAEKYATILLAQTQKSHASLLSQNFNEKVKDGSKLLKEVNDSLEVSVDTVRRSPEIEPLTQDRVYRLLKNSADPYVISSVEEISFDSILEMLATLNRVYDWKDKESSGSRDLFRKNADDAERARRLRYWASLTHQWIKGLPVSALISRSIAHAEKSGVIYGAGGGNPYQRSVFDPNSKVHINHIIDETLSNLEYGLGFRIPIYLKSYYDICVSLLGEENAGLDLSVLIEFGTTSPVGIELQQIGYTRDSASELWRKGPQHLQLSVEGKIAHLNVEAITLDQNLSDELREETIHLLGPRAS